jgi:hypothetical protein
MNTSHGGCSSVGRAIVFDPSTVVRKVLAWILFKYQYELELKNSQHPKFDLENQKTNVLRKVFLFYKKIHQTAKITGCFYAKRWRCPEGLKPGSVRGRVSIPKQSTHQHTIQIEDQGSRHDRGYRKV